MLCDKMRCVTILYDLMEWSTILFVISYVTFNANVVIWKLYKAHKDILINFLSKNVIF